MVSDYATLMVAAAKLAAKYDMEPEGLRYDDGHDWVMIEDDTDLEFALDFATNLCKRPTQSFVPATLPGEATQVIFDIKMKMDDKPFASTKHEMRSVQSAVTHKKDKKGPKKEKSISREAIQKIIDKKFEKKAKKSFRGLLTLDDLPEPEVIEIGNEPVSEILLFKQNLKPVEKKK